MARKRFLLFHCGNPLLRVYRLQVNRWYKIRLQVSKLKGIFQTYSGRNNFQPSNLQPLKAKTLFFLLFLCSFFLTQCFAGGFLGAGMLPILAHSPATVTVVQSSPSPNTLVEQGKALYDAGKFSSAAAVLQQAVATFKTQGDVLKTAMTLSNLSLTYQQLGLWSEAQQAIADSLKLLQSGENTSNLPKGGTSERSG